MADQRVQEDKEGLELPACLQKCETGWGVASLRPEGKIGSERGRTDTRHLGEKLLIADGVWLLYKVKDRVA